MRLAFAALLAVLPLRASAQGGAGSDGSAAQLKLELLYEAGVGDGGPALEAPIGDVRGLAVDRRGGLFLAVADQRHVRKVDRKGDISTVAGQGVSQRRGAPLSEIEFPTAVAVAPDGTIYVADENAHRVWKIDGHGTRPCAGTGRYRSADRADEGNALDIELGRPSAVAVGRDGAVYIADRALDRIFVVDGTGKLRTLWRPHGVDHGQPQPTPIAGLDGPEHVAVSPSGTLYFVDSRGQRLGTILPNEAIEEIDPPSQGLIRSIAVGSNGVLHVMAGSAVWRRTDSGWSSVPAPNPQVGFGADGVIAVGGDGVVFVADRSGYRVYRIDPDGSLTAVAGNGTRARYGDEGDAGSASFSCADVVSAAGGAFYVSDTLNHRVARVGPGGQIENVAGHGEPGADGDGGDARPATLSAPVGLAVASDGSLFLADPAEGRIRRVSPAGIISTVAGTGTHGFGGDGGLAAELNHPGGVAVSDDGSLYISDSANFRIRRVDPLGQITTVAGNGEDGDPTDGADAAQSPLGRPQGIAVRQDGTIVVAIPSRYAVREIGTDGTVRTLVDDVPAGVMRPWTPLDVATTAGADYVTAYGVPYLVRLTPGAQRVTVADAARLAPTPPSGTGALAFRSVAARQGELLLCEEFSRRIWRAQIGGAP